MMKVLVTSRSMIPSVQLCSVAQLTELSEQKLLEFRFVRTTGLTYQKLNWADLVVFVRAFSDYEKLCFEEVQKSGRKAVYVLDDDLINIPPDISSADLYDRQAKENIAWMLSHADLYLTPSRNLLRKYGTEQNRASLIEEPARAVLSEKSPNGVVRIGFAGSMDRTGDLNALLEETVLELLKKYGTGISVEFFGAEPEVVKKCHLRHIPYTRSYEEYVRTMTELNWDIGLAPMRPTEFSSCKHYNKLIEYSSYGIAGVYTDCEPYVWAVEPERNGLLCKNTAEQWTKAISRLVEDSALRSGISRSCLQDAKTRFSIQQCASDYYNLIEPLFPREKEPVRNLSSEKRHYDRIYVRSVLRKYRFGVLKEAVKRLQR